MTTARTNPIDPDLVEAEAIIRAYNGIKGSAATRLLIEYERRGYEIERLQQRLAERDELDQLRQRVEALEAAQRGDR